MYDFDQNFYAVATKGGAGAEIPSKSSLSLYFDEEWKAQKVILDVGRAILELERTTFIDQQESL